MHALEILRNGNALVVAGTADALMLRVDVSVAIEGDGLGSLDVGGMKALDGERRSHLSWLELLPLVAEDEIDIRLVETASSSAPMSEQANDSEEFIAGQEQFEKLKETDPPAPRPMAPDHPDASIALSINGAAPVIATLEGGRHFISLGILWTQWHPERCRVSLRSSSVKEALDRTGGVEWFLGNIAVGDCCKVKVAA